MDKNSINDIMDKIKALVRKGNVSRVLICKDGRELVNIPVNVGIVGGVIGLAAAKWVVIASVLATIGFGCTVQVIKEDGEVTDIFTETQAEKTRSVASGIVEEVKEKLDLDKIVEKAGDAVNEVKAKIDSFDEVVDASVEEMRDETRE